MADDTLADDTLAKMVWAAVARTEINDDPEAVVERTRRSLAAGRYAGLAAIAEECCVPWPLNDEHMVLLDASAWAGKARWALRQRDAAVRLAVADGAPKRRVANAIGMSPPAVDRIIDRAQAERTRW